MEQFGGSLQRHQQHASGHFAAFVASGCIGARPDFRHADIRSGHQRPGSSNHAARDEVRVLELQHPDAMVLAVADVDRAALNEHAMGPREFTSERSAVGTVAALACSNHGRNRSVRKINPPNHVILGV